MVVEYGGLNKVKADFGSHHIEGFAAANGRAFSAPLVSHIVGNLWTGGCKNGIELPSDFDFVLSLYPWEKYKLDANTDRLEVQMYDSADLADNAQLEELAEGGRQMVEQGKTLIHCQAGLNRSGLIATLVLRKMGYSSVDAIALLREKRCDMVLCNKTFEDYLLGLDTPL